MISDFVCVCVSEFLVCVCVFFCFLVCLSVCFLKSGEGQGVGELGSIWEELGGREEQGQI